MCHGIRFRSSIYRVRQTMGERSLMHAGFAWRGVLRRDFAMGARQVILEMQGEIHNRERRPREAPQYSERLIRRQL
jgi:hypothetical protein